MCRSGGLLRIGFERALEFGLRGALVVRFEGSLVLPAFHDHEAIRPARLLQDGELEIRGLAAARVAELLDEIDALGAPRSSPTSR